jgi:hypothetical protein
MEDYLEDDEGALIDSNVEILLEDITESDDGAYIYVRIEKQPDDDELLCEVNDTPQVACGRYGMLSKGTGSQLATCFLLLFQHDEFFMETCAAAVQAYRDLKSLEQ